MEGLTIIETTVLQELISKVEAMGKILEALDEELKGTRKPYLTLREAAAFIGFSTAWVNDHKFDIGCSTVGGQVRLSEKTLTGSCSKNTIKPKLPGGSTPNYSSPTLVYSQYTK